MPPTEVLVAMAAQRCGISVQGYTHTRTVGELQTDTRAWMATFVYPARLLLSALSGGDGDDVSTSTTTRGSGAPGVPSWYRRKPGVKYNAFDLGPTTGQETDGRGSAQDWNLASSALRSEFSRLR